MRIDALQVGMSAERRRVVSDADVRAFADATGDHNPVHLDEEFARTTRFGGRIAHGMLVAGHISAALATDLPGSGTVYMSQSIRFMRPVRVGSEITVRLEILEVNREKSRARVATTCFDDAGQVVIEGEALVLVPKE